MLRFPFIPNTQNIQNVVLERYMGRGGIEDTPPGPQYRELSVLKNVSKLFFYHHQTVTEPPQTQSRMFAVLLENRDRTVHHQ